MGQEMPELRQGWHGWWWLQGLCTGPLCPACCLLSYPGFNSQDTSLHATAFKLIHALSPLVTSLFYFFKVLVNSNGLVSLFVCASPPFRTVQMWWGRDPVCLTPTLISAEPRIVPGTQKLRISLHLLHKWIEGSLKSTDPAGLGAQECWEDC